MSKKPEKAKSVPVARKTASSAAATGHEPYLSLRREIDRLFDDFSNRWPFRGHGFDLRPWTDVESRFKFLAPVTDMVEKDKEYVLTAELPGLDEKEIEVNITDDAITISGEKSEEKKEEKENYHLSERHFGSIKRSYSLPKNIAADKIEAKFQKGVLTVVMPKAAQTAQKERKIKVSA